MDSESKAESMPGSDRALGYYWVLFGGRWIIARWALSGGGGFDWWAEDDRPFRDEDFELIGQPVGGEPTKQEATPGRVAAGSEVLVTGRRPSVELIDLNRLAAEYQHAAASYCEAINTRWPVGAAVRVRCRPGADFTDAVVLCDTVLPGTIRVELRTCKAPVLNVRVANIMPPAG